ncbi:hypothetical protein [Nocardioides campestrisoli]|uniref:hypothetical protein n=1 Tax=Nocardioides campestrisoli TaxID=2736757 RepID=UPI00163DDBE6|nr:hypothetical protein [Nocardioides campestrisoli]
MRQRKGAVHTHFEDAHADVMNLGPFLGQPEDSYNASMGKSSWHLAADLVEQYSPLIYGRVMERVRAREARQRAANDKQQRALPDTPLAAPVTYLLDELPIFLRQHRKLTVAWSVLAVVEVIWHPGPTPMDAPTRENRLRLARAYPTGDTAAWLLVLGELERPDFVIADAASSIQNAVTAMYDGTVPIVPSLYHAHRNIREGIVELAGTTHVVEGRAVPLPQLAKHLDVLTRSDLLNLGRADWSRWWDSVIAEVADLGAPVEKLLIQRDVYEDRIWTGIQVLTDHPHLPASNAAIENRLRATLSPFLENRKQLFRNIARTNCLLDLAVARAQGAFRNLDDITHLLREDNEAHGGWAPTPRAVADPQPPYIGPPGEAATRRPQVYSSLRNRALVPALLAQRTGSPAEPTPER